ncbi:helix-turn-helix domain-containing GNAT family N-acetyltransferase [Tenacibaculum sp. 190524A02b]|uniref:helix-turn-helix domain-containing GNAT family N-acetyltransferase n=1 Tax=Tenacibaculum vairaonense TaxID=3137860 RepID=UPI0031FB8EE7
MIDVLTGIGELGMGSRLKRVSEYMMRETQIVYNAYNIDFDPYLFPTFKIIMNKKGVTNSEIKHSLKTSQPAVTQTLNKLLKRKLIFLKEDKEDKRKKIIFLSEEGKLLVEKVTPIWKSIETVVKNYTAISSNSLIEHLNILEEKFNTKNFSTAILEHIQMTKGTNTIEIISYENTHAQHFYNLNIEWLKTFFYVEPYDEEVLSKPKEYIINKGGFIFFAKRDNHIVGTVALMPKDDTFELTKMAVSPKYRGHKIGQQLMQHCINFARENDFPSLILYSSKKLENAIYIYRKYGFIEVPVEPNCPYIRCDIKMKLNLNT